MGMFDLFSKDGREQRARDKNTAAAINKYKQSPDRMKALQALRDDGSPEALYALIRRFGMMYDKTIEDEQEKEWVFEMLVGKGGVRARAPQEIHAGGGLDLVAAAAARQDRRRPGQGHSASTSSSRCSSVTSPATSVTRPRRSSC